MSSQVTGEARPTPAECERLSAEVAADLGERYRLLGYLGRGGFATVWQAEDRASGETLAVKRFHARQPKPRAFYGEISALYRVRHPGIVRLINLLEKEGGSRYLLLEYCGGGTLRAALSRARKRGGFPVEATKCLAMQLAEALQAAHDEGMAHRDVKPENVLFVSPPALAVPEVGAMVKLADFGLARLLRGPVVGGVLACLSGSPAYMAPEQFQGEYDAATDRYALGILLYEMLTGLPPFLGSPEELARRHLYESPNLDNLPPGWANLIAPLLAKDPTARPLLSAWLTQLRAMGSTHMNAWKEKQEAALERDLECLEPSLTALGAMKRGRSPRPRDLQLLRQYGFPAGMFHPALDRLVDWDDGEADSAKASEEKERGFPGLSFEDEKEPVAEKEAAAEPAFTSGHVEEVLGGFDWR